MDCLFIPFIFGCPTKIKQQGDQVGRICPRCNNAAVVQAKSRTWFEFCFVPLFPMTSKFVWICGICRWEVKVQQGWEPQVPQGGFMPGGYGHQPAWNPYQPAYVQQPH